MRAAHRPVVGQLGLGDHVLVPAGEVARSRGQHGHVPTISGVLNRIARRPSAVPGRPRAGRLGAATGWRQRSASCATARAASAKRASEEGRWPDRRRLGAPARRHRVERDGRHTGRTDLALTDPGVAAQAEAVGRLLDGRPLRPGARQPAHRARETCAPGRRRGRTPRSTTTCASGTTATTRGSPPPQIRENVPGWTVWTGTLSRRREASPRSRPAPTGSIEPGAGGRR